MTKLNAPSLRAPAYFAGIDVGGTFTDVVLADPQTGRRHTVKRLTTPEDPSSGALEALEDALHEAGADPSAAQRVVHATTLATNLVLEGKGARVGYVATRGFGDLLMIGRETRTGAERYDLLYERRPPLVPRRRTVEVDERMSFRGEALRPLDEKDAEAAIERLAREGAEAVAVCLLHSYVNPSHERRIGEIVQRRMPGAYVALSSEVWPEFREYDRAITAVMSAYIGPLVARYLERLEAGLGRMGACGPLQVMQSNGGITSAGAAAARPIACIESGPAAGVIAAAYLGGLLGRRGVISFDMGGTTAKAGLVRDGRPAITHEFHAGGSASAGGPPMAGYPIKAPVIDLAEVGAGGGSIAWVDAGGILRVGPQSAGAKPGPACYCLGGDEPTVTDADLVLGYLNPAYFLGGKMRLDETRAREAIARKVAKPLGMDAVEAAAGIYEIVNASMASAIRLVTVQRGIDPRDFMVMAFGGAGPAHIVAVAEEFGIPSVVVPVTPGLTSAMGLLAADMATDYIRTAVMDTAKAAKAINGIFEELEAEGLARMAEHGVPKERVSFQRQVDLRYRHQSHELSVPAPAGRLGKREAEAIEAAFHGLYEERYGLRQSGPVELVNFRLRVMGAVPKIKLARATRTGGKPRRVLKGRRKAFFKGAGRFVATPVYDRDRLVADDSLSGPAIVEEPDSTIVVPPGYQAGVDEYGSVVITRR